MVSRMGCFICLVLGIATVTVPVVAGNVGRRLGTYTAVKQANLDRTSLEPITVEPFKLEPISAHFIHQDCPAGEHYQASLGKRYWLERVVSISESVVLADG